MITKQVNMDRTKDTVLFPAAKDPYLLNGQVYEAPVKDVQDPSRKKFYIESYGCQMNFSDSEIVASILHKSGYGSTRDLSEADLVLLNTCSIREKAELTVRKRLTEFRNIKQ